MWLFWPCEVILCAMKGAAHGCTLGSGRLAVFWRVESRLGIWPQLSPRRRPFPSLHEQAVDLVEQHF